MKNKVSIVLQCFVLHYFSKDWIYEYYFSQKALILLRNFSQRNTNELTDRLHPFTIHLLFLVRLAQENSEIVAEIIPIIFDLLANFETDNFRRISMDHHHWLYLYAEIRKKITISNSNELKRLWSQLFNVLTIEKQTISDPKRRSYTLYLSIKTLELEGTTHSYHKLNKAAQKHILMHWVDLECTYRYEIERSRTEEELREKWCLLAKEELSKEYTPGHVYKAPDGDEYMEDGYFVKAWILHTSRKWEIFPLSMMMRVIESLSEPELTHLYEYTNAAQTLWKAFYDWDKLQAFHVKDSLSAIAKTELQSIVDLFHITHSNVEELRRQSRLTLYLENIRKEVFNQQTRFLHSVGIDYKTLVSKYSEQAELLDFFRERTKDYRNYLAEYFRALIMDLHMANEMNYSYNKVMNRFNLLGIYQGLFLDFQNNRELKDYYTKSLYADSHVSFLYKEGLEIWQRIHSTPMCPMVYNRDSVVWSYVLSNIDRKLLQQENLSKYKLQTIAHFMDLLLSFDFPVLALSPFFSDSVSVISKFIDIMASGSRLYVAAEGIYGEAISMIGKLFTLETEFSFKVHRFGIFSMLHGRSEYAIISKSVVELYEQGNQLDSFLELLGLFVREGLPEMVGDYHVIEEAVKQHAKRFRYLESALNLFLRKECGEESIVTVLQLNPDLQALLESIVFALK